MRLRSPAQRAPQTRDQATAILARYAAADLRVGAIEARRQALLARVNQVADAMIAPIAAEMKDQVKTLKPWFAANFDELTGGKRKSIELGGCQIGYRISPPKVHFAHGTDDAAVAAVAGGPLAELVIRTRHSLDKPEVLKLLDGEQGDALRALGFDVRQPEVFFVDRLLPKPTAGGDVADPDAGAVA